MKSIWDGLGNRMGVRESSDDLMVTKRELDEQNEVYIIQLPTPAETPEAFYVGALFKVEKIFLNKKTQSARYFTLELGQNIFENSPEYHFCEWVGNPLSGRDHKNYGQLPNSEIEVFVNAIIGLI